MLDKIRALPQPVRILIACAICLLVAGLIVGAIELIRA
jgi:hypothetical protein